MKQLTEVQAINRLIKNQLGEIEVCRLCRVEAFRQKGDRPPVVDVRPITDDLIVKADGTEVIERAELITDVPIQWPGDNTYFMTFPVRVGAFVIVVFSQRSIEDWKTGDAVSVPEDLRRFDLSDAVAIPYVRNRKQPIANFNMSDLEIRNAAGDTYFRLASNLITIKAQKIKLDGDVDITGETVGIKEGTFNNVTVSGHTHYYTWTDPGGASNTNSPNSGT